MGGGYDGAAQQVGDADAFWDDYSAQLSHAAGEYVRAIRDAGAADRNTGGARLLGQ